MKILIIEPYFAGSHKYFHEILCKTLIELGHEVQEITMKARHWRWRIQGAHFSIAPKVNELLNTQSVDLIFTNSLLDVCSLMGMLSKKISCITFFHEHQMSYPLNEDQSGGGEVLRDHIFPGIHASQYLSSDLCLFSSQFNRDSFLEGLKKFFQSRPEKINFESLKKDSKLCSLPLVGNFSEGSSFEKRSCDILWNHRWEYDKNPDEFKKLMAELKIRKSELSISLLAKKRESVFEELKGEFNVMNFGGPEERSEYLLCLSQCRILPVTSLHDFFGLSVREAILCGVIPVLPKRMVYPECIPESLHSDLLYDSFDDLKEKCLKLLDSGLAAHKTQVLRDYHRRNDITLFKQTLKDSLEVINFK